MRSWAGWAAATVVLTLASCGSLGFRDHVGLEKLYWQSPVILPDVTPDLRRPGFWVSRLDHPDDVIMDAQGIQGFNQDLVTRKLVRVFPPATTAPGILWDREWARLKGTRRFLPDGTQPTEAWWNAVRANLNAGGQDPVGQGYALATAYTDQRILPDRTRLTAEPLDADFDDFQNSAYDIGTEFEVSHQSTDGQWLWARGRLSDGWMDKKTLGVCDRSTIDTWESWLARDSVVVTDAKADLFGDQERKSWKGWLRMGVRLPLEADEGTGWRVTLPVTNPDGTLGFQPAWIDKASASRGFLPYTSRTIVSQAFKFLDRPYGWGDSYGEQDCSRFIAQVFATVGVVLPRNSRDQGQTGLPRGTFKRQDPTARKLEAVLASPPGLTILRLDGHIMLYLGTLGSKTYVIHSFWGYTQMDGGDEVFRVVNRTAVSTLDLGAGSTRGSLLDRILDVRELRVGAPGLPADPPAAH